MLHVFSMVFGVKEMCEHICIYILRQKIVQYYAVHKPKRQFKFRNKVLGPKNHGKDI